MSKLRSALVMILACGLVACAQQPDDIAEDAALFTRPWLEPIYLDDRPLPSELGRSIQLAAALGEYEPASVGLRTRTQLVGVSVRVEGIDESWFETYLTRYIEPLRRWRPIEGQELLPGYLDPFVTFDMAPGESRQIWLEVHVPLDAKPGVFEGRLVVEAERGLKEALSIPLRLEVRPFALAPAPPDFFTYGDNHELDPRAFVDAREHGMNTLLVSQNWTRDVTPLYSAEGWDFTGVFDDLEHIVDAAHEAGVARERRVGVFLYWHLTESIPRALARAGITHPRVEEWGGRLHYDLAYEVLYEADAIHGDVYRHRPWRPEDGEGPWDYFASRDPYAAPNTAYGRLVYEGWVEAMRALDEVAERRGWPPFFYYLIDEPHHSRGAVRLALAMGRASEEAGSISFVTCNEPTVSEPNPKELWFKPLAPEPALRLGPWLDIRAYANKYLGPETRERTREAGALYATYVNVYGNDPASVRMQAGALAWQLELDALMAWAWHHASAPSGDFRAHLRDWKAMREGIDDLRYLETLGGLLESGRGSRRTRDKAQILLDELRDTLPDSLEGVGRIDSETGRYVWGEDALTPLDFDRLRARAAGAIEDLLADRKKP